MTDGTIMPGESVTVDPDEWQRVDDPDGRVALALFGPDHRFECPVCHTRFGTLLCPRGCRLTSRLGRATVVSQDNAIRRTSLCGDDCPECVAARAKYLR